MPQYSGIKAVLDKSKKDRWTNRLAVFGLNKYPLETRKAF